MTKVCKSLGPLAGALLTSVALCVAGVSAQTPAPGNDPRLATITGDRVRVRTGPSTNHFPFAALNRGAGVIVHRLEDGWARVSLPPYLTCWIHGDYVREAGDGVVRVSGLRVRLRGTPGTSHTSIGIVGLGAELRTTGSRDKSGVWVQVYGTLNSVAYVHKDFIKLGKPVSAAELPILFRGLRPPRAGGALGRGTPGAIPVFVSARLSRISADMTAEQKKPVPDWDFARIRTHLASIVKGSEDLGEIQVAKDLIERIDKKILPFQASIVETERKLVAARRGIAWGEQKEKEISRAVHRTPPRSEKKYLAVGWVVGLVLDQSRLAPA